MSDPDPQHPFHFDSIACPWGGHVGNVTDCGSPNQNAFLTVSVADSLEAALRETYEETHLEIGPQNINKNQFILMETSKN
jgi:8-oxo-dGTP pyrophosphatase MutT (NUDIX family)